MYKIGDIIRIKEGLTTKNSTQNLYFIDQMSMFCGAVARVFDIHENEDGTFYYTLEKIDGEAKQIPRGCGWVEDWLEPIEASAPVEIDTTALSMLL